MDSLQVQFFKPVLEQLLQATLCASLVNSNLRGERSHGDVERAAVTR